MWTKVAAAAVVLIALSLQTVTPGATVATAQDGTCIPSGNVVADLGTPGQDGATYVDRMARITDIHAYRFRSPGGLEAQIYVGDQWYDLDLGVYSVAANQTLACWQLTRTEGLSQRNQRRVLQFIRPDERILENLPAGEHLLIVQPAYAAQPAKNPGFSAARDFTIRIALGPPLCAVDPPNVADPIYPSLKRRVADETSLYQLGMSIEPKQITPFSLMTFSAVVSPPYTDLFDFEWAIDGRTVTGYSEPVLQWAAGELPASTGRRHRVDVIAHGAREYPDPEQPHVPPTLAVSCTFTGP